MSTNPRPENSTPTINLWAASRRHQDLLDLNDVTVGEPSLNPATGRATQDTEAMGMTRIPMELKHSARTPARTTEEFAHSRRSYGRAILGVHCGGNAVQHPGENQLVEREGQVPVE